MSWSRIIEGQFRFPLQYSSTTQSEDGVMQYVLYTGNNLEFGMYNVLMTK